MKYLSFFEKLLIGVNIILLTIILVVFIYIYNRFSRENFFDWKMKNSTEMGALDIKYGDERSLFDSNSLHPTDKALYVTKKTNSYTDGIAEFRHSNGSQGIGIGYCSIYATGGNVNQELQIHSKGNYAIQLNPNSTRGVTIGDGSVIPKLIYGTNSWTGGGPGSSRYDFAHNLGRKPLFVSVTYDRDDPNMNYTDQLVVTVDYMDDTKIYIRAYRVDSLGGRWSYSWKVRWLVIG